MSDRIHSIFIQIYLKDLFFNIKKKQMKRFLLLAAIMAFLGCEKDAPLSGETPCMEENWGHLKIRNNLGEAYNVYVDGAFKKKLFDGQSFILEALPPKSYTVEAREIDYVFSQNIQKKTTTVVMCETTTVSFN